MNITLVSIIVSLAIALVFFVIISLKYLSK
jgi:hypothetical protein